MSHLLKFSVRAAVRASSVAIVAVAVAACSALSRSTEPKTKAAASIVIVQGGGQTAQAGKDLPTPIVFRVLDSTGVGVPGATVRLSIVTGGGAVTPASDTTDGRGEFKAKWTLGPGVAAQRIVAAVAGVAPLPVDATALLPTQIVLVQGNNQTGKVGAALTNSIIVRVVGPTNVPMQGVTVGFQVLSGGGAMSPLTVVTNALGEASTKWTLGTVGLNTALVVSGTLTPVSLSATATP